MFISKVLGYVTSKISPVGELYAESKNGIKVYRHVAKSGKVKLSSFTPNGEPYKTITRQNIDSVTVGARRTIAKSQGHNTDVQNHQTGITTRIRKLVTQYTRIAQTNAENTSITREYSRHSVKDGNTVGKLVYVEETPRKGIRINADYDQAGNVISRESDEYYLIA